jgi:hypothetical protein
MAEEMPPLALDRIERAIARIDAALAVQGRATEAILRRHANLRARMEAAVAALDDAIARGGDS